MLFKENNRTQEALTSLQWSLRVDFGSTGHSDRDGMLNFSSWRLSTCEIYIRLGRRSGKEMKKEEGQAFKLTINLQGRMTAEE